MQITRETTCRDEVMSKKSELPQTRRHVLIFDEDWAWLEAQYGQYSISRIGTGTAIKTIIHHQVRALRQQVQDNLDARRPETSEAEAEGGRELEEAPL